MNFDELKDELFARGTNYLEENATEVARAERWLNQGYREILNLHPWGFLETTDNTQSAPVSLPDLRRVVYVKHLASDVALKLESLRELVNDGYDLSAIGVPQVYYFDGPSTINTLPTNGDLIGVRYIKRVPPLTGTETPIFDEEYHNLIVDKAMIRAYIDGDNFDAALALKAEVNETLAAMAEDYLLQSPEVSYIRIADPYDG
jgi:hypothetical protein